MLKTEALVIQPSTPTSTMALAKRYLECMQVTVSLNPCEVLNYSRIAKCSASFLAEISVSSPRKLFIFMI